MYLFVSVCLCACVGAIVSRPSQTFSKLTAAFVHGKIAVLHSKV